MYCIGLLFVWNSFLNLHSSLAVNLHLDGDLDTVETLYAEPQDTFDRHRVRGHIPVPVCRYRQIGSNPSDRLMFSGRKFVSVLDRTGRPRCPESVMRNPPSIFHSPWRFVLTGRLLFMHLQLSPDRLSRLPHVCNIDHLSLKSP